ncbi:helix-turn-helix transcriptional regulator [Modestobacter excelsi]|uniref:helix-turn-helix transcriptional regulator n=1 Tax=Modestobacter excelsi TaxID=2213161 RepID=UPI00110CCFA2|nr:helix-turn-helix domain-containing protein [Modestobacter excelsi]
MDDRRSAQVAAVAALAEPTRRRVYDHVVRSPEPVSRDDAAAALGVPRPTVAFHLDRLVADGLLDVHYERRSGRSGPGAGRPAKLYRRAERSVSVQLPERRYDLAGQLLAAALTEVDRTGERPAEALGRLARDLGEQWGARLTGADPGGSVLALLERHGFEPHAESGGVALANCPFHALARDHTELVCGMNLHLLQGVLDAVPGAGLAARLQPTDGACCVRIGPTDAG